MNSDTNLWPRITSFENLYEAFREARRAKRTRPDVASFEFDLETNLLSLQRDLLDESYRPGGYGNFVVREPTMWRHSAAPFRDRAARPRRTGCPRSGSGVGLPRQSPRRVLRPFDAWEDVTGIIVGRQGDRA